MKKVTMNVAAIAITISSFGQNIVSNKDSILLNRYDKMEIINTAEDMIEYIEWDVENGRIYKEYAELYVENLQEIIARATRLREDE